MSGATTESETECQQVQRGLIRSILLVFSVTLATVVNVRLIFSNVPDILCDLFSPGRECFGFHNGFTYYSEGNATSTIGPTNSVDCFWLSSQLCKPFLTGCLIT